VRLVLNNVAVQNAKWFSFDIIPVMRVSRLSSKTSCTYLFIVLVIIYFMF